MAENNLIIDDEYCSQMGKYFQQQGIKFDKLIENYVSALELLRTTGAKEGEFAKALDTYISYAGKLKEQIGNISDLTKKQIDDFLTQVDSADQYIF